MSKFWEWVLDLFYPSRCVFCRRFLAPGPPRICPACQAKLPRTEDGRRRKGDFFSECISALYYEGDVREAIHRYKFNGVQAYAPVFGELTASVIYEQLEGEYDILSWVPLDPKRRRERGHVVVGDDPRHDGADGHDIGGRAAQHLLGLLADAQEPAVGAVQGHQGRLAKPYAPAPHVHQRGHGAQVDGDVSFKKQHISLLLGILPDELSVSFSRAGQGGAADLIRPGHEQGLGALR